MDIRLRGNRCLVVGRAGMDLYADPPGARAEEASRFTSALGGSAANIAAGIVKLGGAAALLTTVSDDAVGRFVLRELERYGVDRTHVRAVGGQLRTSLAVVETRLENCQSVIYRNGAADFDLAPYDVSPIDFAPYAAVIVTGTSLAVEPSRAATFLAMSRARAAQVPLIFDVDYRPYSWDSTSDAAATCRQAAEISDMVIGNDVEFDVMAGGAGGLDLAGALSSQGRVAIYKMGERGSITFGEGPPFETPVDRVVALKPTGAGDAFMAGLVTGLAAGLGMPSAVRRGTAAAAIVVTRVGCAPACPTLQELDDFIEHHPRIE
ncbi:MAG: permease [Alphaproteobacteria bacterium]|nr:permease [Alphaproteobacteria bacterium]